MTARVDMQGQRFGRLVVLEYSGCKKWSCICDCGNNAVVSRKHLVKGITKSCGCLKTKPLTAERDMYRNYKYQAMLGNYPFDISFEGFLMIIYKKCFYCGAEPSPRNGVDRLDNGNGYVRGNMVPCCGVCNMAKGTKSVSEFILWVMRVANHIVDELSEVR